MIDAIRSYFNHPYTARRWMILFFIPIAAVNIIIYYPSLFHFIRGDTFIHTATTSAYKGFYASGQQGRHAMESPPLGQK